MGAYFGVVLVLFVVVAVGGSVYFNIQTRDATVRKAAGDATLTAGRAASELSATLPQLQAFVDRVAALPGVTAAFDQRNTPCTLSFGTVGLFTMGHADVIAPDGSVICTSMAPPPSGAVYAGAGWLRDAMSSPRVLAPIADPRTGATAVIITSPIPGRGVVAAFADLRPLAQNMFSRFGGSLPQEFLVTTADGSTALSRSSAPERWSGAPLAGTLFAASPDQIDRPDLEGVPRVYGKADAAGSGWHIYVGTERAAVLDSAASAFVADLQGNLGSLVALLIGLVILYRGVARPIRRISDALSAGGVERIALHPVAASGPTEIVVLANEINNLSNRVAEELTERRAAELEAQARRAAAEVSEARFSAYFLASPVPSLIVRRSDNAYIAVNDAFAQLVGRSGESLIGKCPPEVGVFADPEELGNILEALKTTKQVKAEVTLQTSSGELRPVLSFVQPTEVDGEACLIVGCVDLSEQKRMAALEQHQLVVEEASRAKSAFLANMSHELRTPLNAILGFSKLLLEQVKMTDRQKTYLSSVYEAGRHLLGLINDVLDVSKVEAGKMELRLETVALAQIVEPAAAATRLAADERGVRFDVGALPDLTISVDATRLRQIVTNLLSNAVKFTKPGGRVELAVRSEDDRLVLEVSDSGIGIPQQSYDRVFGAFERLHEGTADAPGTGLGLALTKQLVELHGGTIAFTSSEGVGTTFRVQLPGVVRVLGGWRLLVVEDDRRDASLLAALARAHRLPVEIVTTVAEALAAIDREAPVGVVLDLRLPDGRGETVIATAREHRPSPIPVLVVTVEDDGSAAGLGVDDYMTKPLDSARFERWLAPLASASARSDANPAR